MPEGTSFDRVREWWGRAHYEPDAVDPERLVEAAADGTGPVGTIGWRQRLLAGRALAALADHRPQAVAEYAERLEPHLGEGIGRPLARAIGAVAKARTDAADRLVDRLADATGPELDHVAVGVRRGAETTPRRVGRHADVLVATFADVTGPSRNGVAGRMLELVSIGGHRADDPDAVRSALAKALAAGAAEDPRVRSLAVESVTAGDPGRRACGARVIGATRGAADAERTTDLLALLDDRIGAVQRAAARGLADVADARPDALAGEIEVLVAHSGSDAVDGALTTALTRVARADADVFDDLLTMLAEGVATDRIARAVARSADAHPERFGRDEAALAGLFDVSHRQAARAVETAGGYRPDLFDHAVDPLLDRADAALYEIWDPEALFGALATLSEAHPRVPRELIARIAVPQESFMGPTPSAMTPKEGLTGATGACAALARTHPRALWETTVDHGGKEYRAAPMLRANFRDGYAPAMTTRALANLGRHYPEAVRPGAEESMEPVGAIVVRRLRTTILRDTYGVPEAVQGATEALGATLRKNLEGDLEDYQASLFELAGIVARVAPDTLGDLPDAAPRIVAERPDLSGDAVPVLAGLATRGGAHADRVAELLGDGALRTDALCALADASERVPGAMTSWIPRFLEASESAVPADRRHATRALAMVAADGTDHDGDLAEGLATLVYDPDPSVRRWAAFGLGELDERIDRVERVAGREDDARATATLALVRAGRRSPGDAIDRLATVAAERDPPIARAAVEELREAGSEATGALRRVRAETDDPEVRRRARTALGGE